jgi:hypothetical protein
MSEEPVMTQPNPISETPDVTFQPPCPKCGNPMWLVRLSKYDASHDLRAFECQVCEYTESNVVEFKVAS